MTLRVFHCDLRVAWAGGQNQLLLLARGLRERGHEQWILTRPGSPLADRARAEGFEVLPHPYRAEIDPRGVFRLWRRVRAHRPDILHAHESHALLPAAIVARLAGGCRVVAHRRVDLPIGSNPVSRWKYERGADRIVAISRRVRDVLRDDRVPDGKIRLVHSGIEVDRVHETPDPPLRRLAGGARDGPVFVTVAVLKDYKDHPTLIEAAARLRPRVPEGTWVVFGDGPLLAWARAEVERRGLGDRVRYVGYHPRASDYVAEADGFVLTSKTEGLGTSVLDAMRAGVPVVATAAGGIPDIVEHGRTGLLAPVGDAGGIAALIDRVLDDPVLARRLARDGADRVRDFDIARTVERTERVYREVVGR